MSETIAIPANSSAVRTSTTITDSKKTYRVRFTGFADCQTELAQPVGDVDAIWWVENNGNRIYGGPSSIGQYVYIKWNGQQVPQKPFNATREYIFTGVRGTDAAWTFQFIDPSYTNNNVGTIAVEITEEGPAGPPPNTGGSYPDLSWAGEPMDDGEIGLRTGEKMESLTDISLNTPVGTLAFTRTYRQSKRSTYQFMGLGWTHNHAMSLAKITGTPNTLVVQMPNGGELKLTETTAGSNSYKADAGSDAVVTYNTGTTQYTLTASDKSTYIFNNAGRLLSRGWPGGETWTYTYDGSNRLTEVNDGYGRKLVFAYRSNPGQFDDGQLWRIGDHMTTNLTGSPSGRYVEFGYTTQKNNGTPIASPKALLASVRDVRGQVWTYQWYGQVSGQSNANQLDFLVEILSPSVDTSGDGTADGPLSLEQLSYVTSGATLTNLTRNLGSGLLTTAYAFQPGGLPKTTETIAGKVSEHEFLSGVYKGFRDPAGNFHSQNVDDNYRPVTIFDANGNTSQLDWSGGGKQLLKQKDALNNAVNHAYVGSGTSTDALDSSVDPQGRKVKYEYTDTANPLRPTRIKFFDTNGTTVLRWQEFTYDNRGRVLSERLIDPANGTTILKRQNRGYYTDSADPVGAKGLLKTIDDLDLITPLNDVSTTLTYDDQGRVVKTQKTSMFGCCQFSYVVYDAAGLVVAEIKSSSSQTIPTSVAAAIAMFDPADPDKNRVTVYEYDAMGRRVKVRTNAGASFEQVDLTAYDALGRVKRTITNYVAGGITAPFTAAQSSFGHGARNDQNQVVDTFYNARGMIRQQIDTLDNVSLFGYDDAGRLIKTIQNANQPNYNNDYSGTSPDPTLGSYSPVSNSDKDLVTSTVYDKAGNPVKITNPDNIVTFKVYDALNRVVKTVSAAKDTATVSLNPGDVGYNATNDPRSASYAISTDVDRDYIETAEFDALGRLIRTQRLLENRPTAEWETTLYGYDALGRSVKVIKVASNPTYNIAADPALNSYSASSNPDQDIVTRTAYDKLERVMWTEDPFGSKTWIGYDGLSRPVKQVVNAVGTASDGSANDPRSATYVPSSLADRDLVTITSYNADGRVQSVTDPLNRVTRYEYDKVGRVKRTVRNYIAQGISTPDAWEWEAGIWKQPQATGGAPINHGADNDQNQITSTVYDGEGRPSQVVDHRNNVSLSFYDELDRPRLTIQNYLVQGASNPANWVWSSGNNRWENGSGSAISFGTDNDQNRISTTLYDLLGRVLRVRAADGRENRNELDAMGRRYRSIVNYVDGTFNSAQPDEDLITTTAFFKTGAEYSITDARGTQTTFDRDKLMRPQRVTRAAGTPLSTVTFSAFDKAGRVWRAVENWSNPGGQAWPDAKDGSGNWSWVPASNGVNNDTDLTVDTRFDRASRPTRSIVNYRVQGTTNPVNWIWSTANNRWENGAGVAIAHGASNDQNLIQLMTYYKDGQVEGMTDPEGVVVKHRYDALRRKIRTVQSYVVQGASDPANWVWETNVWKQAAGGTTIVHGTNNDQNIIQVMTFDKGSRVLNQREPRGNLTTFAYDLLDRRKSLTNPLSKVWSTVYADLASGGTRRTMSYPGLGASPYTVQQDFDRLGRPLSMQYGDPVTTPDVKYAYNALGDRTTVSEYTGSGFTNRSRETQFTYDKAHRIKQVGFDINGDGTADDLVSYDYDAGGLRTKLTLPGSLNVNYTYNARGQLISLQDWDSQTAQFSYDLEDRPLLINRHNGLQNQYQHDTAGRLRALKHTQTGGSGSFGATGLKDDFNRANSASLGSAWGAFFGDPNLDLFNNQCRNPAADGISNWAGNYYNVAQYGPDVELYLTLTARPTNACYLSVRLSGNFSTPNGYAVGWNGAGSGVHRISRLDNGTEVPLGSTFNQALAVGDSVGIRVVGSIISVYHKPSGGNWTLLASRTDSTYAGAGYLGIEVETGGWMADNFGGGTVSGGSSSFGATGLKDDFNRANSASLGSAWGAFFGDPNLDLFNNQCRNPAADGTSNWAGNYYNVAQYGPDAELYLTLTARPTNACYLSVRVSGNLSTPNGYAIGWNGAGSGVHRISRLDNGTEVPLGSTFNQALAVGDSVGIRVVGSTISVYHKPSGGSWTLLASRTDSTYAGAGYLGIEVETGGWMGDNFGGGTVTAAGLATTLADFQYQVDKRGNRLQALETLAHPATATDTIIPFNDKGLLLTGTWANVSSFKESTQTTARLSFYFLGNTATLSMGKGPDHSKYEIWVNDVLWQTVDGYASVAGQQDLILNSPILTGEGPHRVEVRNTNQKHASSTAFKVRFKQLLVAAKTWTLHTVEYTYDRMARLLEARYNPNGNTAAVDADLLRRHLFTYDRAHNQLSESVALNGGTPTVTNRTYNAANQISSAGFSYDNNGNLTNDGAYAHTWDRANRLVRRSNVSGGNGLQVDYSYDALGNRYRRRDTVFAGGLAEFTTAYFLMDIAGGLPRVIREMLDASVTRYIHSPMGIFAQKDNSNAWEWMLNDGLGSVRSMADNTGVPLWAGNYAPYGAPFGDVGTDQTSYGFTGEQSDPNGLVYLRARYHSPALGQFLNLDPVETFNRYGYVDGNVINRVDPSGLLMMFRRSRYDDDAPVRKVVITPPAAPKAWSPVKVSSWTPTIARPSAPASASSSGYVKGAGFTQSHNGVSTPSSSGKFQRSTSQLIRSDGSSSAATAQRSLSGSSIRNTENINRIRQALQGTARPGRGSNSSVRLTSGQGGRSSQEPCGLDVPCLPPLPGFGTSVSPGDFTLIPGGKTPDIADILRGSRGGQIQIQDLQHIFDPFGGMAQPGRQEEDTPRERVGLNPILINPHIASGLQSSKCEETTPREYRRLECLLGSLPARPSHLGTWHDCIYIFQLDVYTNDVCSEVRWCTDLGIPCASPN